MSKNNDDGIHFDDPRAQELYKLIVERGRTVVRGLEGLGILRKVLEEILEEKKISIEWDPRTPAKLKDHLTIGAMTTARFGLAGVGVGLLASIVFKRPALCMLVGGATATLAGGLHAYMSVKQGWRLRGYLDEHGEENVEVIVKELPESAAA